MGEQRTQRVPRAEQLERGLLGVPGFPIGRYRVEFRAESQNVFNHTQWDKPNTGFTNANFMTIRTLARSPRTVQVGARFVF